MVIDMVPDSNSIQSTLLDLGDHNQLLDVINLLRSQGKSSVLNAISSFDFPVKDALCTRFAIELILRRSSESKVNITITPGADRSAEDRARFAVFQFTDMSIDNLPDIIEKAKETMGIGFDGRALTDDVLRLEYFGLDQPNLTLVDLPGVIHSKSKLQSAEDVRLISKLVKSYLANGRSVILAAVSAKNDYAKQIITNLAHEVDPKGQKTMRIITWKQNDA